ncbi:MAG: EamA family transporter [Rikenellaceae bacterium]
MEKSINRVWYGVALMVLCSLCTCFGQLCWKLGAEGSIVLLLGGFALYGVGVVLMVVAYRFAPLTQLQPVLSLSYVLTLLIAHYVLDESISVVNVVGVAAIVLGVVLIVAED